MIGSTLGHYRVLELLGKGGMGEVYLAEDTRLHRRIAIKVLSRDLAGDADRRARLEKEARAVAALNHPHIVTIYSVEEHEGTAFLTLELVEGQTLATMIPPQGLDLQRLLALATPIADAVGAAHHRGITHRDLKPSNVMVSDEGRIKVLDFGLARVTQAARDTRLASMSTVTGTTDGRIAGTAAYMSPEQAEGRPVDSRSDVFSLGILLYEMATGQRPFKGATQVSLLSAILKDTPPPITELRGDLPADLARIIRRCLEKDPERRYQTAKDLRNDLRALADETASASSPAVIRATDISSVRRRRLAVTAVAGAVLIAGAIAAKLLWQRTESQSAREPRISFAPMTVKTVPVGQGAALSPDGRLMAYIEVDRRTSQNSLWIRQADGPGLSQIPLTEDATEGGVLQFTPDGSYIYYFAARNAAAPTLHRIATVGGSSQLVFEGAVAKPAFSGDSARMALLTRGSGPKENFIVIADADGRNPRRMTRAANQPPYSGQIAWSADGRWLAATREASKTTEEIAIIDPQSAEERALPSRQWAAINGLAWAPDGRSLFISATENVPGAPPQIWSVSYPSGEARRITNGQGQYLGGFSLSSDGRALLTRFALQQSDIWVAPVGKPQEAITMPLEPAGQIFPSELAWAGEGRLVFTEVLNGNRDIWSTNTDGTARLRLTSGPEHEYGPSVHQDSRIVVYTAHPQGGTASVWRVDLDGRNARRLAAGMYPVVSADGKAVYYRSKDNVARTVSIDGANDTVVYDPAAAGSGWPAELRMNLRPQPSPDGRWVAMPEADAKGIALVPLVRGEASRHYPTIPVYAFNWTGDGRGILYSRSDGSVPAATFSAAERTIWLQPAAGGEPRNLGGFSGAQAMAISLSPDGKRIAVYRTIFTVESLLIADGQK